MKSVTVLFVAGLVMSTLAASAQTTPPSGAPPSAQNSGAGIQGTPGNKNGPPAEKGTVGSSATMNRQNPDVSAQDPANVKGLPGNKSGPAVKPPSK